MNNTAYQMDFIKWRNQQRLTAEREETHRVMECYICDFMITDLKLSSNSLLIFACIFSCDKIKYKATQSFICNKTGLSKRTIQRIVDKLIKEHLIKVEYRYTSLYSRHKQAVYHLFNPELLYKI